jgi:hypothetical protein
MRAGDAFLYPIPTEHLWIVITNPNASGAVLIVNITSIKTGKEPDLTVPVRRGEHPYVTHDSFVYYREAMTKTVTELAAEEKAGRLKWQDICTAKLLEVVRSGVSASPHTRRGIAQFYKDHKNIPLPAAGPTAAPAAAPKDSAQKPT